MIVTRLSISPAFAALVIVWMAHSSLALGQIVEIPRAPIRLEISRSAHQVKLCRGDRAIKIYPVAVGRTGWKTPLGQFEVFQMLRDPAWKHPLTGEVFPAGDPGNELGHYWIGFATEGKNFVGFHGTPHPDTVGKSLSHGCIRMYDKDIETLFREVSVGTVVSVLP